MSDPNQVCNEQAQDIQVLICFKGIRGRSMLRADFQSLRVEQSTINVTIFNFEHAKSILQIITKYELLVNILHDRI